CLDAFATDLFCRTGNGAVQLLLHQKILFDFYGRQCSSFRTWSRLDGWTILPDRRDTWRALPRGFQQDRFERLSCGDEMVRKVRKRRRNPSASLAGVLPRQKPLRTIRGGFCFIQKPLPTSIIEFQGLSLCH